MKAVLSVLAGRKRETTIGLLCLFCMFILNSLHYYFRRTEYTMSRYRRTCTRLNDEIMAVLSRGRILQIVPLRRSDYRKVHRILILNLLRKFSTQRFVF